MEAIDYLRQKSDIRREIKLDDDLLSRTFQMVIQNAEDIVAFDGIDLARIVEKGKVFG